MQFKVAATSDVISGTAVGTSSGSPSSCAIAGQALSGRDVLIVINSDGGGGVEMLAGILEGDLKLLGARVKTLFIYPNSGCGAAEKLMSIARATWKVMTQGPDIVIAFQPTSAAAAGIGGRLSGCRARIMHQSNMPLSTHVVPRAIDRVVGSLGFYTCNIANSAATQAAFAEYPAVYRRRMLRIDHGVVWRQPVMSRAEALAKYGVPDDQPIILSCARLAEQKSLNTVVAALSRMKSGRYVIIGRGPEEERLREKATRLGIADRVHFLGHVENSQTPDLYAAADVVAFPSIWETFGLALVEAAYQGVPIVASNLDTSMEVLAAPSPGPTRFVATWDPEAWARAMQEQIDDPTARPRAETFAVAMRERHSVERMLEQYRKLYAEVLR